MSTPEDDDPINRMSQEEYDAGFEEYTKRRDDVEPLPGPSDAALINSVEMAVDIADEMVNALVAVMRLHCGDRDGKIDDFGVVVNEEALAVMASIGLVEHVDGREWRWL